METIENIVKFFQSPAFRLMILLVEVFLVVLWLSIAYWTYRDAKSRGTMAGYWAFVSLIFPVFGLLIYLVVRPPERADDAREREMELRAMEAQLAQSGAVCPACMKPVERDFLICPHCLKRLKKPCPECDHALKLNWTICPYCQSSQ
jgi:hypothetical protein